MGIIIFTIAYWGGVIGGNYFAQKDATRKVNIYDFEFFKNTFGAYVGFGFIAWILSLLGMSYFLFGCLLTLIISFFIGKSAGDGAQENFEELASRIEEKRKNEESEKPEAIKRRENPFLTRAKPEKTTNFDEISEESKSSITEIVLNMTIDRYDESIVTAKKLISNEPDFSEGYFFLAKSYLQTDQKFDEAMELLEKAKWLNPDEKIHFLEGKGRISAELGSAYMKCGYYHDAFEMYRYSLTSLPDDVGRNFNFGIAALLMRDKGLVEKQIEKLEILGAQAEAQKLIGLYVGDAMK
jgi:tetratricopeptide (TPR) repeat protein